MAASSFPPDWDPNGSGLTFIFNPANDIHSKVTVSPEGTKIKSSPEGFQAVPSGRVWGTAPTIEFLTLPGDKRSPPVVFDCRNNRPVSNDIAQQLKHVRDMADDEAARAQSLH